MSTSLSPRSSGSLGGSGHPTRQQLDELDALLQRMLALPVNQADDLTAELNAPSKTTAARRPEPVSYQTVEYSADTQTAAENEGAVATPIAPRLDDAHLSSPGEAKEGDDNWVPLSSTWKPSPHTWKPLAQSWQQPRATPLSKTAQESPPSHEETVEVGAPKPTPPAPVVAANTEPKAPRVPQAPVSEEVPLGVLGLKARLRDLVGPPMPASEEVPVSEWLRPLLWFNIAFDCLLLPWGPPGRWLRRDGGGRSVLGVVGVLLLIAAVGLTALEWFGWTWDHLLDRIR
jgi:hypothetical protein